ncbi:MAG: ABC transporter substrate-binding protein [Clostridia bacterium]|nr:ABC transporter substrate-binding protein [Clostridia bacterium]
MKKLVSLILICALCVGVMVPAFAVKDTLTWAQGADVTSMDPHIGKETPAIMVTNQIFDTLLTTNADGDIEGQIAESWEYLSDTEIQFNIRKGIKFHDGSDLTAEDVKFSLDRAIASTAVSYIVNFISEVELVDEYTVIVRTANPYAAALRNLAHPSAAIVSKAFVEADEEYFTLNPMGSGPYKFVEWRQGDSVKLEAFADYYAGEPLTKNLVMKVVPEAAQRTIALETGEIDLATDIQANDAIRVQESEDLVLYEEAGLSCWYISMNMRKAPFDKVEVRQAIRYAIDAPAIIDAIMYGAGEPAADLIAPAVFGYAGDEPYEYNPDKARELLAEAGYADGFSCTLWVNDNQSRIECCQAVAGMLLDIGIDCQVEIMEFGSFIERCSSGEHDMAYFGWTTSTADADYTYYPLIHSTQTGAPGNRSFIQDPEADRLIELGRNSTDEATRKEAYAELEKILQDVSPNAPIFYSTINAGANKNVENFVLEPAGYHKLEGVTVAE